MFSVPFLIFDVVVNAFADIKDEVKLQKDYISFKKWKKDLSLLSKHTSPKLLKTITFQYIFQPITFMYNSPETHLLLILRNKKSILKLNRKTLKEEIFEVPEGHGRFNQCLLTTDGCHVVTYLNNSFDGDVNIFSIENEKLKFFSCIQNVRKIFQILNFDENIGIMDAYGELNIFNLAGDEVKLRMFYCEYSRSKNVQFLFKSNILYLNTIVEPKNQIFLVDKEISLRNFSSAKNIKFEVSNDAKYCLKIENGCLYIYKMFNFKDHLLKLSFLVDVKFANFTTDSLYVWLAVFDFILCYSLITRKYVCCFEFPSKKVRELVPSVDDELFILTQQNTIVKYQFKLHSNFRPFKEIKKLTNINFKFY
jgi:hypothetical protein